jgi:hypothetical protein
VVHVRVPVPTYRHHQLKESVEPMAVFFLLCLMSMNMKMKNNFQLVIFNYRQSMYI